MIKRPGVLGQCRFCAIQHGGRVYGVADQAIWETPEYYTLASIGGFIEGWTLIVPRHHTVSLRDFYNLSGFLDFLRRTVTRVEHAYGPAVVFEHGPNHTGSLTSCGTDHGHLHVVPLRFSLLDAVRSSPFGWNPVLASAIRQEVHDSEYLFFSETPRATPLRGHISVLAHPVSQFFRRVIAANVGLKSFADYKKYLFIPTTERTHDRLVKTA